jgi:DNA helicase-2/ATP-dependent DNA helicase PcrA
MVLDTGLREHYKPKSEGADRLENLEELVNAAEAFVTQEGFGKRRGGAAGGRAGPPGTIAVGLPAAVARWTCCPMPKRARSSRPWLAFLTHASLEAGDNQAQAGRTRCS